MIFSLNKKINIFLVLLIFVLFSTQSYSMDQEEDYAAGVVHLTIMHTNNRIYHQTSLDGVNWPLEPYQLFRDQDYATPQSVNMTTKDDKLYLAIVAGNDSTNIATYDGKDWNGPTRIFKKSDWRTHQPMTLAFFPKDNLFHLIVIHNNYRIYHATSRDGITWPDEPEQLFKDQDYATPQPVNMLATKDKLYLAVVAGDRSTNIATYDGQHWDGPNQIFKTSDWRTPRAMTLAFFPKDSLFHLTVIHGNNRIYHATSTDGVNWLDEPYQLFKDLDYATPEPVNMVVTKDKLCLAITPAKLNPAGNNKLAAAIAAYDGKDWVWASSFLFYEKLNWETPQAVTLTYRKF